MLPLIHFCKCSLWILKNSKSYASKYFTQFFTCSGSTSFCTRNDVSGAEEKEKNNAYISYGRIKMPHPETF